MQTGLAGAAIDAVLLLEIAGVAVAVDEIAQGAAARGDRQIQDVLHSRRQSGAAVLAQPSGCGFRADAGGKQRFVGVDVADADDDVAVHQELLDRGSAAA